MRFNTKNEVNNSEIKGGMRKEKLRDVIETTKKASKKSSVKDGIKGQKIQKEQRGRPCSRG